MKTFIFLGLCILFFSCGKQQKEEQKVIDKSDFNTVKKHVEILDVSKKFETKIENWLEYESVNEFIQQFNSISPSEAINNSRELNNLVKSLRDSIKPTFLESPAFHARVNLLYNETLRLYDMSSISSIKADQVNLQVEKIVEAFSSVNSKINTTILQQNLDREIENGPHRNPISIDTILDKKPKVIDKIPRREGVD